MPPIFGRFYDDKFLAQGARGGVVNGKILLGIGVFNWLAYGKDPRITDPNHPLYASNPWSDPDQLALTWEIIDPARGQILKMYDDPNFKATAKNPYKINEVNWSGDGLLTRSDEFDKTFRGVNDTLVDDWSRSKIMAIWQGDWNAISSNAKAENKTAFASALYLQKRVTIETNQGKIYDFQTSYGPTQSWLSESAFANSRTSWVVHSGNFSNSKGSMSKSIKGRFHFYNYDGESILYIRRSVHRSW